MCTTLNIFRHHLKTLSSNSPSNALSAFVSPLWFGFIYLFTYLFKQHLLIFSRKQLKGPYTRDRTNDFSNIFNFNQIKNWNCCWYIIYSIFFNFRSSCILLWLWILTLNFKLDLDVITLNQCSKYHKVYRRLFNPKTYSPHTYTQRTSLVGHLKWSVTRG